MAKEKSTTAARRVPKTVLRLPDLDQAKSAVLNSLSSSDAQRGYRHAIDEDKTAQLTQEKSTIMPHPM